MIIFRKTISNIKTSQTEDTSSLLLDDNATRMSDLFEEAGDSQDFFSTTQNVDDSLFSVHPSTSTSANSIPKRKKTFASGSELTTFSSESDSRAQTLTPTPSSGSTRKRFSRGRESDAGRSSATVADRHERTELLKTLIQQRAEPEEVVLSPLQSLFLSLANSIETFPETDQIDMKQAICNLVMERERMLAQQKRRVEIIDSSAVQVFTIQDNMIRLNQPVELNVVHTNDEGSNVSMENIETQDDEQLGAESPTY